MLFPYICIHDTSIRVSILLIKSNDSTTPVRVESAKITTGKINKSFDEQHSAEKHLVVLHPSISCALDILPDRAPLESYSIRAFRMTIIVTSGHRTGVSFPY